LNALPPASPCELFSHLYVEDAVWEHPETRRILERFDRARVIRIRHYKDVFNRPNQSFDAQSRSKNLILAELRAPFVYDGSFYSDAFGFEHFFYAPTVLGCLYDCDYCYLQGLYGSANTVLFVNIESFFDAVEPYLDKPTLLAVSYDTDTLAVERIAGHSAAWIAFAADKPNLHLEIRTKSANFRAIEHLEPNPNVVIAWTLSPQEIIDRYEHHAPPLAARLKAAAKAVENGWKVRLSIDPVIYTDHFDTLYPDLIETVFASVDAHRLHSLTLGSFRMSSVHLKRLKKRQASDIAFYPYRVENQIASYPESVESRILDTLVVQARRHIGADKIRTWRL
jgi:spore photoproduct lyase